MSNMSDKSSDQHIYELIIIGASAAGVSAVAGVAGSVSALSVAGASQPNWALRTTSVARVSDDAKAVSRTIDFTVELEAMAHLTRLTSATVLPIRNSASWLQRGRESARPNGPYLVCRCGVRHTLR